MKHQERCACCGHVKTAYTLPLNDSLVKAFIHFAELSLEKNVGLEKGEIGLTNAQYSNFQNLRHFNLIRQYEKGRKWYLTDFGKDFYYGNVRIKTPVAHMDGKTLDDFHPAWKTHAGGRVEKLITDYYQINYKKREEYQKEKSPQGIMSI
jgi:hypothetical protein